MAFDKTSSAKERRAAITITLPGQTIRYSTYPFKRSDGVEFGHGLPLVGLGRVRVSLRCVQIRMAHPLGNRVDGHSVHLRVATEGVPFMPRSA